MGLAREWLSEIERENLALELLRGQDGVMDKTGKRVLGLCPFHDEKTPSFNYRPDQDFYHCFGCGVGGDLIKLYCHLRGRGRDDKEAFKEFRDKYGPPPDRLSREEWLERKALAEKARVASPPAGWAPREVELPPEMWMEKAGRFVEHSRQRLAGNRAELARLVRWGFDLAEAWRCGLGWNDQLKKFPGRSWGLADDVILYNGLVIPFFEDGRVIRIKIRRPEPDLKDRYRLVKGSSVRLPLYQGGGKVLVVETERDAAMLWGRFKEAGWSFLATGGASYRPCRKVHEFLKTAELIAVALDNDKAGFQNWHKFWRENYPQAVRWPMPQSWGVKDPGEAAENKFNLGAWLGACERAHGIR